MEAGIHSVSLARQKVTLDPNIAYQWSISLSGDTKNRSLDKIASASIQRNEPPADLAAKVEKASAADKAIIYAEAGFWYDAIQSISTAIGEATKAKDDKAVAELKSLRASLLEQGSLKEAAAADRK